MSSMSLSLKNKKQRILYKNIKKSKFFEDFSCKLEEAFNTLNKKDPKYDPRNWEPLWPGYPARWVLKFISTAFAASVDSTCLHRHTGATLVDIKTQQNGILAPFAIVSCFNGAPTGIKPCTKENACRYKKQALIDFVKEYNLDQSIKELPEKLKNEFKKFKEGYLKYCQAIHAEQNAIYFSSTKSRGKLLFATTNPCPACARMLVQNEIGGIIYSKSYKLDPSGRPLLAEETKRLFEEAGIPCIYVPLPKDYWGWLSYQIKHSGEGIYDPLYD